MLRELLSTTSSQSRFLGDGELSKKLTVKVDKVSASAKAKIEAAGGKVEAELVSKGIANAFRVRN